MRTLNINEERQKISHKISLFISFHFISQSLSLSLSLYLSISFALTITISLHICICLYVSFSLSLSLSFSLFLFLSLSLSLLLLLSFFQLPLQPKTILCYPLHQPFSFDSERASGDEQQVSLILSVSVKHLDPWEWSQRLCIFHFADFYINCFDVFYLYL